MKKRKFKALKGSSVLVVEVKHCWIRLAIVKKKGQNAELLASTEALSLNPQEAFLDCLEQLKSRKVRIPKKAVLVTTEALPAYLEVPIDESMSVSQVEEMLQWEMETHLENFTTPLSRLGILYHPDFLPADLRQRLKALHDKAKALGEQSPSRTMLIDQQVISEEDFDAIEDFMANWPRVEEASSCTWRHDYCAMPKEGSCVTTFMSRPRRDIWRSVFRDAGLNLHSIVPWHFSAFSLVDLDKIRNSNYALIENSLGLINCTYFQKGQITEVVSYPWNEQELPKSLISDLDYNEISTVSCIGLNDGFERLKFELQTQEDSKVLKKDLSLSDQRSSYYPILAAAKVAWQTAKDFKPAILHTATPPKALYKRPALYWSVYAASLCASFAYMFKKKEQSIKDYKESVQKIVEANNAKQAEIKIARENELEYKKLMEEKTSLEKGPLVASAGEVDKSLNNQQTLVLLHKILVNAKDGISFKSLDLTPQAKLTVDGEFKSPVAYYLFLERLAKRESKKDFALEASSNTESLDGAKQIYKFKTEFDLK